jgi:hypothetical protein
VAGNPQMKDLGVLGGSSSAAGAITGAGAVAGQLAPTGDPIDPSTLNPNYHAFVWTPNVPNGTTGTLADAGTLGGSSSYAIGINTAGQIAGSSNLTGDPIDPMNIYNSIQHAFVSAPVNLNHAPTASGGKGVATTKNTAVNITLVGSDLDNDPLTYTVVSSPGHGTLSGGGANRTYTPAKNFTGSDSFTFKVNDGKADSNVATVSISVTASGGGGGGGTVNQAPVARSDSATLSVGQSSVIISVLANDSDPNGDPLTITSVTNGSRGTTSIVTVSGVQLVQYTATGTRPKANTKDTFTYTISDGKKGAATATVTVTYK